jgi:hypothetical protein
MAFDNPYQAPLTGDTPNAGNDLLTLRFLGYNLLFSACCGAAVVVLIMGLNFFAFAFWLAAVIWVARTELRMGHQMRAGMAVVVQGAGMVVIVIAAVLAPGKTTERFLDRTITIPNAQMTLSELAGSPDEPKPEWCPFLLSISVPENERATVIDFPGKTISLRQFVDSVEHQSTLRHRFMHCGNGYTVLWGGDCCFGLRLRHPSD